MKNRKLYERVINRFSNNIQTYVATEEMGELIQALSKELRGQGNRNNIIEEIADVTIMLEQLRVIFDITETEFEDIKWQKLIRLQERVG